MRRLLLRLKDKMESWLQREMKVSRCGNIVVSDMRKPDVRFRDCIAAANALLALCDPARHRRVHRRLSCIFGCPIHGAGDARYIHRSRTCEIDFDRESYDADPGLSVGWVACILVHEATHGSIRARGIKYSRELRSRIEQLCVAEENRFLERLAISQPELAGRLRRDFDESLWHWDWQAGRTAKLFRSLGRIFSKDWRPGKGGRVNADPWLKNGAIIEWRWAEKGGTNLLLDMTPGSPNGRQDGDLVLGKTWSDTEAGLHCTPVAVTQAPVGGQKSVDIVVNVGHFSGNAAPSLAVAADVAIVPVDSTVTFTATASDADADDLAWFWDTGA